MDTLMFKNAIEEIAESKSLSVDVVVEAFKEALRKSYVKYLGGGDDAVVKVDINQETGEVSCAQIKKVVKDVQDDYLEEDITEANRGLKDPIWNEGDDYPIPCDVDTLNKIFALAVKNNFRNELGKAERTALYDIYKDHIGEMVTGTVEKADDRSVSVNIGRTIVELGRREMIGDEYFKIGDPIKVYIQEVKQAQEDGKPSRGSQIEVTRSSEGFLKRLFEEEIHEIYEGTVVIKGVAREAGVRSKVAVASNNDDVDATGACIGQAGSRIQKIVGQFGNGKEKEKIDIIAWSSNPGLFIAESLRPAQVLGVAINDPDALPNPTATAVVRDDQLSLAIGKKGANARLAKKLTGWSIDIVEESIAKEDNLVYKTTEDLQKEADEAKKAADRVAYAKKSQEEAAKREAEVKEMTTAKNPLPMPTDEEADEESAASSVIETPVEPTPVAPAPVEAAPAPVAPVAPVEAAPVAPTPVPVVEEKKPEPVKAPATEVKTTTTLDALEKELEEARNRPAPTQEFKHGYQKNKRPRKITEEEVENAAASDATPLTDAMPIYSQEELDQIAKEENDSNDQSSDADSEEDIDQYDKYYDDGSK